MFSDFDGDGIETLPRSERRRRYRRAHPAQRRKERKAYRSRKVAKRRQNIAILDMETDPFDNVLRSEVFPFLAILYSDQFQPRVIWEDDWHSLAEKVKAEIEALPESYTIYAHNGGRFDYLHLIHLLRGNVMFKGRAIMRAKIGNHEIRDSLHIIPESLKNANQKETFDYKKLTKENRDQYRDEIIKYCLSDCEYTFEIVKAFVSRFGLPLSIGQAALKELRKTCTFENLNERTDRYLRQWFYGGRCECIQPGMFEGEFKLIDVNSMYPSVMADYEHPIGNTFLVEDRITEQTTFLHLRCKNDGALMSVDSLGNLTATATEGEFFTTIWEFQTALSLRLIRDIEVIKTVEFDTRGNFSAFVRPLYEERERLKIHFVTLTEGTPEYKQCKQDITFLKYLLNNAYGKFAQNPRRWKQHYLTDVGECPDGKWWPSDARHGSSDGQIERRLDDMGSIPDRRVSPLPEFECDDYWIWSKATPEFRFNNVATAASITGAARAKLLAARYEVDNPLYCDTDSLVCAGTGSLLLDPNKLGAWKIETDICRFIGNGKKLYAYETPQGKKIIKSKGVQNITWDEMLRINQGESLIKTQMAPTITKDQRQTYMDRTLRRTAWQPSSIPTV